MNLKKDSGLTLIEVSLALTILLIGVGFIMKSDWASSRYQNESQLRQQMLFFAAGELEAGIEGYENLETKDPELANRSPFNDFNVKWEKIDKVDGNPYLQQITVEVSLKSSPTRPEPVRLTTYRVVVNP